MDEIIFDKGLIRFHIEKDLEEDNKYRIRIYICEFRKFGNRIEDVIVYDRELEDKDVNKECEVIESINGFVKKTDYNNKQIEFLNKRIREIRDILSNCNKERTPKIFAKREKQLEKFENELVIATTFDEPLK